MATPRKPIVFNGGSGTGEMPTGDYVPTACGGTGATTAAGALANFGLNTAGAVSFRNRLLNGTFSINQRGAASASAGYAAGSYVLDRWKAGANGCTCSFSAAASGVVTVTITAGTLLQIIEGANYLLEGGAYVLSWSGSAAARAYQGSASGAYVAAPLAVTGWTAGSNGTVEFATGTVTLAQFEPGAAPTPFEFRDDEFARARRYFQRRILPTLVDNGSASGRGCRFQFSVSPPLRIGNPGYNLALAGGNTNVGGVGVEVAATADSVAVAATASAAGQLIIAAGAVLDLNAEL